MRPTKARHTSLVIPLVIVFLTFSLTICWGQELKASVRSAASPTKAGSLKTVPLTKNGHPDLEGIWTNVTLTPLERPDGFAGKPTVTEEEAAKYENRNVSRERTAAQRAAQEGVGGYNALFIDKGTELARVDGVKRTSLIIDPPDGKIPPLTPEARKRAAARAAAAQTYSGPEVRPLGERCLLGFGSTSGPPMLPVLYNNNYQFLETPGAIMILVEMVHDVRVIHMDGRSHLPPRVRQWMGDSMGHWEGDTLVVDTTNFTDKTRFRGSGENLHVVERFRRIDEHSMLYRVTVDDPSSFTRPWTAEYPFLATPGPIFEYACHEGNYAMTDILGGARHQEMTEKQ